MAAGFTLLLLQDEKRRAAKRCWRVADLVRGVTKWLFRRFHMMNFFKRIGLYFKKLFIEARNKLTTYLALITAAFAELPNALDQSGLDALHSVVSVNNYRHVLTVLALSTVWSRVRRLIK